MAKRDAEDELEGKSAVTFGPEERDGYRRTRRQMARGDKPTDESAESEAPVPLKTPYQRFMDEHGMRGWVRCCFWRWRCAHRWLPIRLHPRVDGRHAVLGGLVAYAIYATAIPAYDLIESKNGRYAFAALCILWAASSGYPTLRKTMARDGLCPRRADRTEQVRKLQLPEGKTGPFDVTVSGTLKNEGSQNSSAVYDLQVAGEGANETLSGEFSVRTNQMRVRRGTSTWTEQTNQVEHRPRAVCGEIH